MSIAEQRAEARRAKQDNLIKRIMSLAYRVQNVLWMAIGVFLTAGVFLMPKSVLFIVAGSLLNVFLLWLISELQGPVKDWFEEQGYQDGYKDGRLAEREKESPVS